jgi:hypothetical protein
MRRMHLVTFGLRLVERQSLSDSVEMVDSDPAYIDDTLGP